MFLSARKTFMQQKDKRYDTIPDELLEVLNKNLPNGFKYTAIDQANNIVGIDFNNPHVKEILATMKVKKIIDLPDEINGLNFQEIRQYAYNTQTEKKIKLDISSLELVNGKKKSPFLCDAYTDEPVSMSECEVIIKPPKFQSRKVDIEVNEIKEKVNLIQEISDNNYIYNYRGEGKYFFFQLSCNTKNQKMNVTSSINLHDMVSIDDIITTLKIHRGFCDRSVKLNGHKLIISVPDEQRKQMDIVLKDLNYDISWWEEIQKIEGIIKEKISVSIPLQNEDLNMLVRLYITLVKKEPYRTNNELVNEIKMSLKKPLSKDIKGTMATFTMQRKLDLSNLHIKRDIYELIYLHNAKVTDYREINPGKHEYEVKLEDGGITKQYMIHKYFLTEQEVRAAHKYDIKEAKLLREFQIVKKPETNIK